MFNLNWAEDVLQCSGGRVSWKHKREVRDKIVLQTVQGRLSV